MSIIHYYITNISKMCCKQQFHSLSLSLIHFQCIASKYLCLFQYLVLRIHWFDWIDPNEIDIFHLFASIMTSVYTIDIKLNAFRRCFVCVCPGSSVFASVCPVLAIGRANLLTSKLNISNDFQFRDIAQENNIHPNCMQIAYIPKNINSDISGYKMKIICTNVTRRIWQ